MSGFVCVTSLPRIKAITSRPTDQFLRSSQPFPSELSISVHCERRTISSLINRRSFLEKKKITYAVGIVAYYRAGTGRVLNAPIAAAPAPRTPAHRVVAAENGNRGHGENEGKEAHFSVLFFAFLEFNTAVVWVE